MDPKYTSPTFKNTFSPKLRGHSLNKNKERRGGLAGNPIFCHTVSQKTFPANLGKGKWHFLHLV
jgi:hypothetical protein